MEHPTTETLVIPLSLFSEEMAHKLASFSPQELALLLTVGYDHQFGKPIIVPISEPLPASLTVSSYKLGEYGEEYVRGILGTVYNVEDVSKKGHCGDVLVRRKGESQWDKVYTPMGGMLVEVKNYTSTVPGHEVEKFLQDVRNNSPEVGGMMISLRSDITGVGAFDFQISAVSTIEGGSIPVLYIVSADRETILLGAQVLWAYYDMTLVAQHGASNLLDKMYRRIMKMSKCVNLLSTTRRHVEDTRNTMNRQLQRIYDNITQSELLIKTHVRKIQCVVEKGIMRPQTLTARRKFGAAPEVIDAMMGAIGKYHKDSHLATQPKMKQCLAHLLNIFLAEKGEVEVIIEATTIISLPIELGKKCIAKITLLKTKTKVALLMAESSDMVTIPGNSEYKNGWIHFEMGFGFVGKVFPKLESYLTEALTADKSSDNKSEGGDLYD
jgi:hypothetical protein